MLVTFWSNFHQSGTTSNVAALSIMIALEYRLKVLVAHNQFERSGLETSFFDRQYVKNELSQYRDVGIDALSGFVRYSNADREGISTFTTTIIKNKLDLLMGTTFTNRELYVKELHEVIDSVLMAVKEAYDLVLFDAAGEDELKDKIIRQSDLIVVNLTQNYNALEHFFEQYGKMPGEKLYLLSRYDKDSRLNKKTLQRRYGLKEKISVIPYNIEFSDACMEGRLVDYLMKNENVDSDDDNYSLIQELKNTVSNILEALNVNVSLKKLGD